MHVLKHLGRLVMSMVLICGLQTMVGQAAETAAPASGSAEASGTAAVLSGNEQVASAIEAFITSGHVDLGKARSDDRLFQIFTFYQDRNFKPIWTRDDGVKTKGRKLLEAIETAAADGINPQIYSVEDIAERIDTTNPEILAELDLLLSDVFADFSRDLSHGLVDPEKVDKSLNLNPRGPGPLYLLDGAEQADDLLPYIDTIRPKSERYTRLQDTLKQYRGIRDSGGWPKFPSGKVIKPGESDERIPVLREILSITGDLKPLDQVVKTSIKMSAEELAATSPVRASASGPDTVYDDALVDAVKAFQDRHGRSVDGVIGPNTVEALQVPVESRIRQIVINLERRRWMNDNHDERFIFVNLADQYLKVVEDRGGHEKTIHTARVVVGKPYHSTPVFTETMKYIVINPYWNIPTSIANNEYLPKLRRDPGVLERENIRLISSSGGYVSPYNVDWSQTNRVPFRMRQDTGPGNALGRLKFMFPNRFNIYIHDTPSKSLFAKSSRYFSHGCMRVQDPVDLADVLLRDQGWDAARVQRQIDSGERRIVNLDKPVPVYVSYLTAWANKDGTVHFREDVYGRDKKLIEALEEYAQY